MGLLALLSEEPSHGYQLKAAFESRTGRSLADAAGLVPHLHAAQIVANRRGAGSCAPNEVRGMVAAILTPPPAPVPGEAAVTTVPTPTDGTPVLAEQCR